MTSPLDQQGISWYRQTNGSFSVEFIASSTVLEKVNYGQGFSKERITVNRERFRNGYMLKIRNLQLSDSGLYYCMTELGGKMYFGNGTMLHVVVSLPTTVKPMVKSTPCKCRRTQAPQRPVKGYYCSAVIWAPLAGCAVLLLILLCYCIYHTRRAYRRSRLFFKKMKLQK
ncbi:T-cell surface glycoprotein CD8 beta chain [Discoglossus pictus]